MRIEEDFNKSGYFWLPGEEDKRVYGVLSVKDGGRTELEIVGLLDETINPITSLDSIERIIGFIEDDGLVTLENSFYIKKNISFGGISKSKILVNTVLSGASWDKGESITFNTFSFAVDCLDEWIGISGINVERDWEARTAVINYTPPEIISFNLDNGMAFEVHFSYTLPGFPTLNEAKISQRAYLSLKSEKPIELKEFISVAHKISNLMCFAMDDVVSIKRVSATSDDLKRDGGNGEEYPVPVKIIYQSTIYSEKKPNKSFHDMLFSYGVVKDNASQVFNNWINAYDYLSPAFNLYFSTKVNAQKYLEGKFLALAQGLETYHRRTSDEKLMEQGAFDDLIASIIKSCPEDKVEWLSGRLKHGNEINLGKRLKSIVEPFKDHIGTSKERSKLLRRIVDTRNYLTHYSEELEAESAKGRDLWVLCSKMEAIFILHFLNVIGFTDEEIKRVVENCFSMKQKLKA